jgi:hypothetical protein
MKPKRARPRARPAASLFLGLVDLPKPCSGVCIAIIFLTMAWQQDARMPALRIVGKVIELNSQ